MNENLKRLEEQIKNDLNQYENMNIDDPNKMKALNVVLKELTTVQEAERADLDRQDKEKKFDLEKEIKLKELDVKIEELHLKQKELEMRQNEIYANNNDKCQQRYNELVVEIVKAAGALLGTLGTITVGLIQINTFKKLTINAQNHDYNDYQLESSSSKENRSNILKV